MGQPRTPTAKGVHGVLAVDKPPGPTSHDVVRDARRLFRTREVGHAGTLDPFASGVLVLLFGEATKLSSCLTAQDKHYVADVRLGAATDTGDPEGNVTETQEVPAFSPQDLERALDVERARVLQVPPAYSAIKLGGVSAHARARRGEILELEPRPVRVQSLRLESYEPPVARVVLAVSKGYYVRSFARDFGAALGLPAHLTTLRRTRSGAFTLEETLGWPCAPETPLSSVGDAARAALPCGTLTEEGVVRAGHGKLLSAEHFSEEPSLTPQGELCAWFSPSGQLVALGRAVPGGHQVARGFNLA